MKKITLMFALMLPVVAINAQKEYPTSGDDLYQQASCTEKYDEVEEVCDGTINKLVIHKQKKNVYHVNGVVEEHHYTINGTQVGHSRYYPSNSRPYYAQRRPVVIPQKRKYLRSYVQMRQNYYEPDNASYTCLGDDDDNGKWFFFFRLSSDYVENKEELARLIEYAKYNINYDFYIDAYADAETGRYGTNEILSENRANSIVGILLKEGISKKRLFVKCHGSGSQIYETNSLNRCVTVRAVAR